MPQAPQFWTLFVVAVSQPFLGFASQLPKPAAQTIEHDPLVHDAAPWLVLHAFPHVPQFFGSLFVSRQTPPHSDVPPPQLVAHFPCEQTSEAPHS